MKVTIWEQFSSNHSSSFTIIGKFDSQEKAQEAVSQVDYWWDEEYGSVAVKPFGAYVFIDNEEQYRTEKPEALRLYLTSLGADVYVHDVHDTYSVSRVDLVTI